MNLTKKKQLLMRENILKYRTLNGLYKVLMNICDLLMQDKHYDNCYCNMSIYQCWLCNFADFIRRNNVKNELIQNKQCEDRLVDIAFSYLFYIKKIKSDKLNYSDQKWVLDFFKKRFCSDFKPKKK